MVINSSQVLISELEFRSHSGDLAPLLYYYKQKPCTLQGSKIDNSLTNICRWCTEMCVFWPKAAALPCFPAEHSANAVIHSPYELLVPLIPLKNCFHTSIAARLILPENILLSEDYSTLLFQRILWSLPPIHPENPESPPTYSWISDNFSVTQQVTCSLKCDLLGHILASEAISAKGEKRKFWLLCWLLFSFFLIRFFIGQMFLIGIHHISGTCEDARKESMIEVFPVVMVAYGAPEQSIHFLGNAFAVTIPDCIKQSISIPLLRTVIEPLMICW